LTKVLEPDVSTSAPALLDGRIVDGSRGQYRVETEAGILLCSIRGRLRKQLVYPTSPNRHQRVDESRVKAHDPVAVGQQVRVLPSGGGAGVIEEILAGTGGAFTRNDTDAGTARGKVTPVAGLDQIVAVFAAQDPAPHFGLLDRFLVIAESQGLATVICLNKTDLGVAAPIAARLAVYRALGYPVVLTSTASGAGIAALRAHLAGHISALLGASGVGKSSLLNALEPGLSLRVNAVSTLTHKGRHTTTGTRLVPLAGAAGGALADTAGIRALAVGGVGGRLAWCFRDFRPYLGTCRWSADCSHRQEPGCAVRAAVQAGTIDAQRYDSYWALYAGGADDAARVWADVV